MARSESDFIALIAEIYTKLGELEDAVKIAATEIHGDSRSSTVEDNISLAKQSITVAIEHKASGTGRAADIYADLAYLRCKYAKGIFEAEQVEALLGEGDFLQMTRNWQAEAARGLQKLQQAVANLEAVNTRKNL